MFDAVDVAGFALHLQFALSLQDGQGKNNWQSVSAKQLAKCVSKLMVVVMFRRMTRAT